MAVRLGDLPPDLLTSIAHAVIARRDSPRGALRDLSALAVALCGTGIGSRAIPALSGIR